MPRFQILCCVIDIGKNVKANVLIRVTGFLFLAVLLVVAWLATLLFRGSVLALSLSSIPQIFALLLSRTEAETGREQPSPLLRDQSR